MNVNIIMGQENYTQLYVSTDATADAATCSTLAAFISTLENSELKIRKHMRHCLSSDKAMAIQEAQK